MDRRITVRGIILSGNKLLCVRHSNYRKSEIPDYWCAPGGSIEPGEDFYHALNRELTEELGVIPKIGKLLYIQQYFDSKNEIMELFFHVLNSKDYKNIDLSKTTHGKIEIQKVEFIYPTKQRVLPKFLTTETINPDQTQVKIYSYL